METKFNRHLSDFNCETTMEFDVKNLLYRCDFEISEEEFVYEFETGIVANYCGQKCFDEIMKSKYNWIINWTYAGRTNGWFVLLCNDHKPKDSTINRIEMIVDKWCKKYVELIRANYSK